MDHALALNIIICLVVVVIATLTNSPIALIGLLFLKDMPYGLLQQPEPEPTFEEQGKPAGFLADLDQRR